MRKIALIIFFFTMLLAIQNMQLDSKSLWKDRNIYSGENIKVGDILLVNINDISQMKFSIVVNADNSFNIISNPDANIMPFLPKASANKKMNNKDATSITSGSNLKITIPATVTKELKNNNFQITGDREYVFNGISSRFILTGVIDPSYLKGRTIQSADIASFRLNIRGAREGAGVEIKRPKLQEKEAASFKLTEPEKQEIIVDYLKKIINELSR